MFRYLKLFFVFLKINIQRETSYRSDFLLLFFLNILNFIFSLIFFSVVYGQIKTVAGWDYYHTLLVLGTTHIVLGLFWICFRGLRRISRHLNRGTFDFFLIKPMSSQLNLAWSDLSFNDTSTILSGISINIFALRQLQVPHLAFYFFLYMIFIIGAVVIYYSLTLLLKTIAFWTVKMDNVNMALWLVFKLAEYPTDIYSRFLRAIFLFIIPLTLFATLPAKVLSGLFNSKYLFLTLAVTFIFIITSQLFWRFGLKHYNSASS